MSTLYKFTDSEGKTFRGTQWGQNVTNEATGISGLLCSDSWIHAYEHPLIASLMYPIHIFYGSPMRSFILGMRRRNRN